MNVPMQTPAPIVEKVVLERRLPSSAKEDRPQKLALKKETHLSEFSFMKGGPQKIGQP